MPLYSDEVQLHASNMGESHQEPGGPPSRAAKEYIESVGGKLHMSSGVPIVQNCTASPWVLCYFIVGA